MFVLFSIIYSNFHISAIIFALWHIFHLFSRIGEGKPWCHKSFNHWFIVSILIKTQTLYQLRLKLKGCWQFFLLCKYYHSMRIRFHVNAYWCARSENFLLLQVTMNFILLCRCSEYQVTASFSWIDFWNSNAPRDFCMHAVKNSNCCISWFVFSDRKKCYWHSAARALTYCFEVAVSFTEH